MWCSTLNIGILVFSCPPLILLSGIGLLSVFNEIIDDGTFGNIFYIFYYNTEHILLFQPLYKYQCLFSWWVSTFIKLITTIKAKHLYVPNVICKSVHSLFSLHAFSVFLCLCAGKELISAVLLHLIWPKLHY